MCLSKSQAIVTVKYPELFHWEKQFRSQRTDKDKVTSWAGK